MVCATDFLHLWLLPDPLVFLRFICGLHFQELNMDNHLVLTASDCHVPLISNL